MKRSHPHLDSAHMRYNRLQASRYAKARIYYVVARKRTTHSTIPAPLNSAGARGQYRHITQLGGWIKLNNKRERSTECNCCTMIGDVPTSYMPVMFRDSNLRANASVYSKTVHMPEGDL